MKKIFYLLPLLSLSACYSAEESVSRCIGDQVSDTILTIAQDQGVIRDPTRYEVDRVVEVNATDNETECHARLHNLKDQAFFTHEIRYTVSKTLDKPDEDLVTVYVLD